MKRMAPQAELISMRVVTISHTGENTEGRIERSPEAYVTIINQETPTELIVVKEDENRVVYDINK